MPRNQFRRSTNRPNRSWAGNVSPGLPITVGAGSKAIVGTFVPSNPGIDDVILRTVGMIAIQTDDETAAEEQTGAFGMMIVTDLAVAAGAASIPGPVTDIDNDGWFVHVPFVQSTFLTGTPNLFLPDLATAYHFDSKGKRILQEGETVVLMIENSHGSFGLSMGHGLRILSQVRGTR